jgi:phosphatidate cytidylyltransferase
MQSSLKRRIVTALVLLCAVVVLLFTLSSIYWGIATLALCAVAAWEWGKLAGLRSAVVYAITTAVCGLLLLAIVRLETAPYVAAGIFWAAVVPLWLARKWHVTNVLLLALVGWIVLLPAWLAVVELHALDPILLLWVMSVIWVSDTAAYAFGKRFGRHKLAPGISPNKTWEGALGAFGLVALYAVLALVSEFDRYVTARSVPDREVGAALFIAMNLAIAALSVIGDLFESWIKRTAHAKDSSALLPGHGGVLDRIDGLIAALPLFAFIVAIHA